MRYAVHMTPGPHLNTATAHTWAAVVSGTAWKWHTLSPDGVLTAECSCGPLILWAKNPVEVPVEIRKVRLGAYGSFNGFVDTVHCISSSEFENKNSLLINALGKKIGLYIYYCAAFSEAMDVFRKSFLTSEMQEGYSDSFINLLSHFLVLFQESEEIIQKFRSKHPKLYARYIYWNKIINIKNLKFRYYGARLRIIRSRYRAHVAQRMKRVWRPTPIRRPLYARPRPPSAPLAPPVI